MKYPSTAIVAGTLLGTLFLGGCSADTSSATPAGMQTATPSAPASPGEGPETGQLTLPEARGVDATRVIVDPSMSAFGPETVLEVNAALKTFLDAAQGFPELQKGSRPLRPEDTAILEPVLKPLMTEHGWTETVRAVREQQLPPAWYVSGNPFDSILDDYGNPLEEESARAVYTPDEGGYSYVHSIKQPITISSWDFGDGTAGVQASDVHFRVFYRNLEGGVGVVDKKLTFTFQQEADGKWRVGYWDNDGGYAHHITQATLDAMADF